ncbi:hypothetical protein N9R79_05275 [Vibrio sp.]|nr:hypothetical protein [Vibrio sp.]
MKTLLLTLLATPFISQAATFPNSTFENLDYGLYWFGKDNAYCKAESVCTEYNKNNPTIIYFHGWQNGSSENQRRESFFSSNSGAPNIDLAASWVDDGYNIGIFYWNQFADEEEVKDAEAKIWTHQGPQNMRWKSSNGSYSQLSGSSSITDLAIQSINSGMNEWEGNKLIFAGHSLGNQLAVTVGHHFSENEDHITPDRIALLDPFYSNYGKDYLDGKWVGEVIREYADDIINDGIVIEGYRSSPATSTIFIGDANKALMNKIAFTELKPWFFNALQVTEKHVMARWHYFYSYQFSAPEIKNSSSLGLSASTSDTRVKELMDSSNRLIHDTGHNTKTPEDDVFSLGSRL